MRARQGRSQRGSGRGQQQGSPFRQANSRCTQAQPNGQGLGRGGAPRGQGPGRGQGPKPGLGRGRGWGRQAPGNNPPTPAAVDQE